MAYDKNSTKYNFVFLRTCHSINFQLLLNKTTNKTLPFLRTYIIIFYTHKYTIVFSNETSSAKINLIYCMINIKILKLIMYHNSNTKKHNMNYT